MASVYDVANAMNIRKVITHYTGEDVMATRGNISCPFHKDSSPSFKIYDQTNTYHCFSCGDSGTPINFVMAHQGLTAEGAAEQIAKDFGLLYTKAKPNPEYDQYVAVYDYVAGFFHVLNRHKEAAAENFWKTRGLESLIDEYKLGYCLKVYISKHDGTVVTFKNIIKAKFPNIPDDVLDSYGIYDKYGNCIFGGRFVFPIQDYRGNIVGFSGRASNSMTGVPKYINTSENKFFKKRELLYNWHEARKYSTVFIVEGYTDALSLIAQGTKNVVAAMGTSFTSDHLAMMKDKQIVLALDNDIAGRCKMVDIIEDNPTTIMKVYELKGHEDFNAGHMEGIKYTMDVDKETIYAPEYLIRFFKEELELGFLYKREELFQRVNAVAKNYSPVAKDYFATILKRIIKGRRM